MAAKLNAPRLVRPRGQEDSGNQMTTFDVDAWHAMQARDNALIAERVLEGSKGRVFVYSFTIKGTQARGISVDGAHHLANFYGGLQHRIVASQEKKGAVFTSTSYPAPDMPMSVSVNVVEELEDEPDFYRALVEIKDIKTGNVFQAERIEERFDRRADGSTWEKPHYSIIAQSKARRNALLMLIPKDVQEKFEQQCIDLGQSKDITEDAFTEKRRVVFSFAAKHGLALDRELVNNLANDQIVGLREAMQEGGRPAFEKALAGLGLAYSEEVEHDEETGEVEEKKAETKPVAEGEKQMQKPRGRENEAEEKPENMFR